MNATFLRFFTGTLAKQRDFYSNWCSVRWPFLKWNYQLVHTRVYVKRRMDLNNNKNKARTNDEDYALFLFVDENRLPIFFSPTFHANLEFLNRGRHFSFSQSWDKERLLTLKAQIQDGRNERNVFRVFTRSSYACGFRIYRIFLGYRIFVLCDAKTFLFMVFFNRFVSYLAKA